MSQHDSLAAEHFLQWVTASNETQLRFMAYGLLVSIQRAIEKIPKDNDDSEAFTALICGLAFAASVKDNYDNLKTFDEWLSTQINRVTFREIVNLFSTGQPDTK